MKKLFSLGVIILAILLLLPLSVMKDSKSVLEVLPTNTTPLQTDKKNETVNVFITADKKVREMTAEDYVFGVLAGEMPALYETEALKAQSVCAYTFLKWRQKENTDKDYDITDDYTTDQCYISADSAREKWGNKADEYEQKLRSVIKEVLGESLTYNGETILAVYHAVSCGFTESAKNVWGKDYPYLQAVESANDKQAENYISKKTITAEDFKLAFNSKIDFPKNLKTAFSDFNRSSSGTVLTLKIGDTKFKGSEIRSLFDLKSSNFEVAFKDNCFTFTVYGYGHGVGMSQNGANFMAKQGKTYREILNHYYTGCEIIRNYL